MQKELMFVKINKKKYFLTLNFKQSQKKPGPPSENLKEFGLKILQKIVMPMQNNLYL